MPEISVIVPVYNVQEYVGECIKVFCASLSRISN